jgi:DNA-directed RNA polymerase specialized sigma24 family protein
MGSSTPCACLEYTGPARFSRIPSTFSTVSTLRFGEGFSLEETAAVMKKNINAVKQLQLRALAALNRQMMEYA